MMVGGSTPLSARLTSNLENFAETIHFSDPDQNGLKAKDIGLVEVSIASKYSSIIS